MKNVWEWLKKAWKIMIVLIIYLILSACFFLCLFPEINKENKIEAWAIVTLVFVTIFYATQTQRLVVQQKLSLEEEIKKRNADFLEKRIKEFYKPFSDKLDNFQNALTKEPFDPEGLIKSIDELRDYYKEKRQYILSKESDVFVSKFAEDFWNYILEEEEISRSEFNEIQRKLRDTVNKDWDEIVNKIRKFYGY